MIRGLSTVALLLAAVSASSCRYAVNFHVVDDDKLYRSAQLLGDEWEELDRRFHVRTILNLRGEKPGADWYDDERKFADSHGINLVNIGMSAKRLDHREDLILLLDTYRNAERPILVHCKAGADRTGLAVALYKMLYMGKSRKEAMEALSFKYYHIEMSTPAKDYFVEKLWKGEQWAREVYDPCAPDQKYKYYDKKKYCDQTESEVDIDSGL